MISVVICSIDGNRYNAVCEQYQRAFGNEPYEIIRIPDARSMCDGYNRGLMISQGEIVIFSHDDIEIWVPDFAERLKKHLATFDVVGVAGTTRLVHPGWIVAGPPHIFGQVAHRIRGSLIELMVYGAPARIVPGIQAMDGLFLAFRREVIMNLRWDQQTFTRFHCYDIDVTYRAFKAGYKLGVAVDLPMLHMSMGSFDQHWEEQAMRLVNKHGIRLGPVAPFIRISAQYKTRESAQAAMHANYANLA